VVGGVLESKDFMTNEMSFRWISRDAEYLCRCMTPSVSRPEIDRISRKHDV
jgi:hypothetical protein